MTVAMLCILGAIQGKKILCCREYQNSIQESVHALIAELIDQLNVPGFNVTRDKISHSSGGEFIFKGLGEERGEHQVAVRHGHLLGRGGPDNIRGVTEAINTDNSGGGLVLLPDRQPPIEADPFTERFLRRAGC